LSKFNLNISFIDENYAAAEHFESYYDLSVEYKEWITADDTTYHTDACINLWRIYTTIGESLEWNEELEYALDYLTKALEKAKESKAEL